MYVRGRGAIMMDDKVVLNNIGDTPQDAILTDATPGHDGNRPRLRVQPLPGEHAVHVPRGVRVAELVQLLFGFHSRDYGTGQPARELRWSADVGFGGFTLMAGIER